MTQYALLSVSDKTNILEVAKALTDRGIKLLSTGGTYQVIEASGLPVESVDHYTGFPEMMNGRVKTLHPKIHGGLLGLRQNPDHVAAMDTHRIRPIDFVIVNLYPFKETISKEGVTLAEAIENIDIGGPSMLRSAAKNYQDVTVVTDPVDYETFIQQLQTSGETTAEFREYLARKVFQLTSHYDALIAGYLAQLPVADNFEAHDWDHKTLTFVDETSLRYGENGHQKASFLKETNPPAYSIGAAKQLNGKELSYNNLKDADAAIKIAREFKEPVAVALKHMNPCGVAIAEDIETAFDRCYQADPVSIYGGIVVVNRPVSLALAEAFSPIFLEIIIAPSFDEDALARLQRKKNLRLLTVDFSAADESYQQEFVSVSGGLLIQDADYSEELVAETPTELPTAWKLVTDNQPSEKEIAAMNFGMRIVKHVKSNAIIITNEYMTLGIGAGQMNRVGAAEIALDQAEAKDETLRQTYVMASDAFLPMADTAELAYQRGVSAIVQPGGSIHDDSSIEKCNEHNLSMVMTGIRHFRH